MNKSRSNVFIMLNLIVSFFISACSSPREQVKIENGTFNINGKDVQLICGEMHYPRIPHEYWRDRLHRARAMGLNTVSAYVFWNFHERQPGVFDFSGQADIAEFVRIAQEEGLYVILRPGPYVCAEWDFGGYPSWLLKEKDLTYRSKDPRFMSYCERYIKELGKQLKNLGMLVIQDQVWNRVTVNRSEGKSTRYYVDEFHLLLRGEVGSWSVEIWKRFRKWGGIPTGITQNIKDLLASPEIENIFENSDFIYLLNQASGDRKILCERLNISTQQAAHISNAGPGEGLIFFGNVILPFVDHFPQDNELYSIMTTKLGETGKGGTAHE